MFNEWWKQLYGESEGKDGIGIFPASVEFTADLHSMGQFIQAGPRDLMETIVHIFAMVFRFRESSGYLPDQTGFSLPLTRSAASA